MSNGSVTNELATEVEQDAEKDTNTGAGLVAEWLGSCPLLRRPRVLPVQILGIDIALLVRPC